MSKTDRKRKIVPVIVRPAVMLARRYSIACATIKPTTLSAKSLKACPLLVDAFVAALEDLCNAFQ
jgi:hypothetical protein